MPVATGGRGCSGRVGGVIRVGVVGARGRMGMAVMAAVEDAGDCEIACAVDAGDDHSGLATCDVIVDFTTPDVVMSTLERCIAEGVHCVVGTTGFDEARLATVAAWCEENPSVGVLIAPNFGIGAVLMMQFDGARGAVVSGVHVHSVRARGLIAHQEVVFGGPGETLTIRHDSMDRSSFMPGVLLGIRRVGAHPGLTVGLDGYLAGS